MERQVLVFKGLTFLTWGVSLLCLWIVYTHQPHTVKGTTLEAVLVSTEVQLSKGRIT